MRYAPTRTKALIFAPLLAATAFLAACEDAPSKAMITDVSGMPVNVCAGAGSAGSPLVEAAYAGPASLFTDRFAGMVDAPRDAEVLTGGNGLHLAAIRSGEQPVPRIFANTLPPAVATAETVEERKRLFVSTVLPLVLRVNEALDKRRRFVLQATACLDAGLSLTTAAEREIASLQEHFDAGDPEALLRRLDMVPPSLAVAQAAMESGWGTSRFAQQGNALFGQHGTGEAGSLRPEGVDADSGLRVAAYPHLMASVAAYVENLNTHPAYRAFRQLRAERRRAGKPLSGVALAGTLDGYSERGKAYVEEIRAIIRHNVLNALDTVRLDDGTPRPRLWAGT